MEILIQVTLMVVGFIMLIKGADWFVDGAAGIAAKMGIPQLIIGLTIVAMGTSAPETAVSISSAIKGNADICIGNVVGSNILNVLIILGITATIVELKVAKSTIRYEIPYMIFITIVLLIMGYTGNKVTLLEGAILWALFILYLAYLFVMARKNNSDDEYQENKPAWKLVLYIVVGLAIIICGSNITVDSAVSIAKAIGISERFIGLTIVAFGTSLPELVTSLAAARKGNADIAIGNIVGSNIFNILFVIGTTAFILPVTFESKFIIDTIICIATGVLLWLGVFRKQKLNRKLGIVMLCAYGAYLVYLLR